MYLQTILCPTDYSHLSEAALRYAAALAHEHQALVLLLHVTQTLGPEKLTFGEAVSRPQPDAHQQRLWAQLRQVEVPDFPAVRVEYVLKEGDAAEEIVRTAADRTCDLIVMGSHGRSGWQRFLHGSVTEQVMRRAPCPVLVVKAAMTPRVQPHDHEGAFSPVYRATKSA
jgi:universal stress protein A